MENVYLSSTELKRKTAEILNMVAYGEKVAVIERYGEPVVKITPIASFGKRGKLEDKLKKYFGILPNFPSVSKCRSFRKRNVEL